MAKRPRYSRWRRLPRVYRSGEFKMPDPNSEPQRLTLYLQDELLEAADRQAAREGVETLQKYCEELLGQAIQAKRVREQVADVEAKRGPLEGLHEIANDPAYLVEWSAQATSPRDPTKLVPFPVDVEARTEVPATRDSDTGGGALELSSERRISPSGFVVLQHAGQAEADDPSAFLPRLRRGESVSVNEVAELARALQTLEVETGEAEVLNRRVAFALHRLAYEGQILHTDAWPGAFDDWTVDMLHAVQEAVERILSGQDIRYYPTNP